LVKNQGEAESGGEVASADRLAKIQAISALALGPKTKGIWLLITAGFTWKETAKILHISEATIRDVLAGKEIKEE
jgi:DNA-binding NarL/FixJ family response regulator